MVGDDSVSRLMELLPLYDNFAAEVLRPFFAEDPLEFALDEICREAFDFPVPLIPLESGTSLLELFHGPTAAFKDFGARFLARCFERLVAHSNGGSLAILVATSGDTGAAVAAACHGRPGMRVGVLFPKGGVAPRQEQQLTCWDGNVTSFAVRGTFDDCQRLAKEAFASWRTATVGQSGLGSHERLTSANSINIGRLLPQIVYYAWASLSYGREHGVAPGFVVPSGNVGNAVGALWAKAMGFPVGHIAIATNANRTVPDWFATGDWEPRPSVPTLANAMDVGDPSNMERVFAMYRGPEEALRDLSVHSTDDDGIRASVRSAHRRWGRTVCPHTATALSYRDELPGPDWIVVATAHPAKFNEIVEPLVGEAVDVPRSLAELLARPSRVTEIEAEIDALSEHWGIAGIRPS